MNKIFQIFTIFSIVFILMFGIPVTKSDVIISNNYSLNIANISPCIKYQLNNNMGIVVNLSKSSTGTYGDNATLYVNTTWWSGIASDNSGNTFYVDTLGDLFENFSGQSTLRYLGSPYQKYAWYGPIVGVAVSNNSISQGGALVQELSEWGAVFELNVTNGNTINQGWSGWLLPHSGTPKTLFSAINEVKSVNKYLEIFMYFATNGTIYYYLPSNPSTVYVYTYSLSPGPFVSGTVYAYISGNSNVPLNNVNFVPFGLLFNGSVYEYTKEKNTAKWYYFGYTANGARTINIAPSTNNSYKTTGNFYLLASLLNNNTYVYESNQLYYNSITGTFTAKSIPTSQGTNEAVFNPWGYGWYVLQTNGTIAHSSSWINPSAWNYFKLPWLECSYSDVLNITDSCSYNFTVFANITGYSGIYNMHYYNLTFNNASNKNRIQFIFDGGIFSYPENIINVSSTNKIYVNISFIEDKAYNATLNFIVYTYPQGNKNIIIGYNLKIIMIDHFSYIPI